MNNFTKSLAKNLFIGFSSAIGASVAGFLIQYINLQIMKEHILFIVSVSIGIVVFLVLWLYDKYQNRFRTIEEKFVSEIESLKKKEIESLKKSIDGLSANVSDLQLQLLSKKP